MFQLFSLFFRFVFPPGKYFYRHLIDEVDNYPPKIQKRIMRSLYDYERRRVFKALYALPLPDAGDAAGEESSLQAQAAAYTRVYRRSLRMTRDPRLSDM